MSWDVMIFNITRSPRPSLEELDEASYTHLGSADWLKERLSALLPGIEWSEHPAWGLYIEDELAIEFNMGEDDPVMHIMLHVRGSGDAIGAIARFVVPLGWSMLDCSTSEFVDFDNPSKAGWASFQTYRDRVAESHCENEEN